jgi:hypothetical protein
MIHRHRNLQQNINKCNPILYKKKRPTGFYTDYAKVAPSHPSYKEAEEQKS